MRYLLILLLTSSLKAATYYVAKDGADGNPGTSAQPWLTVQKAANTVAAGDTVNVSEGIYSENVATVTAGGTSTRVVFQPNTTNVGAAEIRQFRVKHPFYTLTGLKFAKTMDINPADLNGAHVRVEPAAEATIITNCWISDTPLLNARFHFTTNGNEFIMKITNSTGNFLTNGFVIGGHIFLGASSVSNGNETPSLKFYTNHDIKVRIKDISADGQTLTVTNNAGTNFHSEPVQSLWASIYAGQGSSGYSGIEIALGTGVFGATNCLVTSCTFSNLAGAALVVHGESNLIEQCYLTTLNASYIIRPGGRHNTFRRIVARNSPNRIWLSKFETATATHPPGSEFFDYNIGALHSQFNDATNITIIQCWFENIEQQVGIIQKTGGITGSGRFNLISNVFIGFPDAFSQNSDWITNRYNTYYKVAYNAGHPLAAGGISAVNLQTNLDISFNAFIACGQDHTASIGWYDAPDTYQKNITNNFVCGPEVMGWPAKTPGANNPITYNGGNPYLQNIHNPIGPDGIAFTDDDGLKPLPISPLARYGVGALTPVTNVAAYIDTSIAITPYPYLTYTNYNPDWLTNEAPDRGGFPKPYTTRDALPLDAAPVEFTFTATNSFGALTGTSNWFGLTEYAWNFGDGATVVNARPTITKTYLTTGEFTVTLWVTNMAGASAGFTNYFTINPQTNATTIYYVATNGNDAAAGTFAAPWKTLGKAQTNVTDGNYVCVRPGVYDENLDINRNVATAGITFVGQGAVTAGLNVRHPNWRFEGFVFNGTNINANGAIFFYTACDNGLFRNNTLYFIDLGQKDRSVIFMDVPASTTPADGQLNHQILDNYFTGCRGIVINIHGTNHLVQGNVAIAQRGEADFIRPNGQYHRVIQNIGRGFISQDGGHCDIFQAFGNFGSFCKDVTIERNIFIGDTNGAGTNWAICQLEQNPGGPYTNHTSMSNLVVRNNQFINLGLHGSADIDGTKWYNNLFYKTAWNAGSGGHALGWGGVSGSAYGTELFNNIFFMCGKGSLGHGWYDNTNATFGTNVTITADYNFVTSTNYVAKDAAPPNSTFRWASDGLESHGINGGDPIYTLESSFDFRPAEGSFLINAGTNLTAKGFTTDFYGVERNTWWIGPFDNLDVIVGIIGNRSPEIKGINLNR